MLSRNKVSTEGTFLASSRDALIQSIRYSLRESAFSKKCYKNNFVENFKVQKITRFYNYNIANLQV